MFKKLPKWSPDSDFIVSELASVFWLASVSKREANEVVMRASCDAPVALLQLRLLQYDTVIFNL